jgi:hypothetical protein
VRVIQKRDGHSEIVMTRYAFLSRHGSVAYVGVTYDKKGNNLPGKIDSGLVNWTRIAAAEGEIFLLLSTADMERDLHEAGFHITEIRTKPRSQIAHTGPSESSTG